MTRVPWQRVAPLLRMGKFAESLAGRARRLTLWAVILM